MKTHEPSPQEKISTFFASVIYGGAFGAATFLQFFTPWQFNPLTYAVNVFRSDSGKIAPLLVCIAGGIFLLYYLFQLMRRWSGSLAGTNMYIVPLPLLPCAALFWLPPGITNAVLYIFLTSWCVMRVMVFVPSSTDFDYDRRWFNMLLLPVTALGIMLGALAYMAQINAYNNMNINSIDLWAMFDAARRLIDGDLSAFFPEEILPGQHFSPLLSILGIPFLLCSSSPEPFFLFNTLCVYSGALLLYLLARERDLPRSWSLGLALLMLLSPVLPEALCPDIGSYRGHYVWIPLLILYFIFREKKHYAAAFTIFVLSLFLRDTLAFVWLGIGVWHLVKHEVRTGTLLLAVLTIYCLPVFYFMPSSVVNFSEFSAGSLLMRLETLFCFRNLQHIAMLLLPVSALTFAGPGFLLIALLPWMVMTMCGALQDTTPAGAGQINFLPIIYVAAVFALDRLKDYKCNKRFVSLMCLGLPQQRRKSCANALLGGTMISAILTFYFFSPLNPISHRKNVTVDNERSAMAIKALKQIIPPGTTVTASLLPGLHFIFTNYVYFNHPGNEHIGEFVLLDLFNQQEHQKTTDQLRGFLRMTGYSAVFSATTGISCLTLFARSEKLQAISDNIARTPASFFSSIGREIPQDNDDFSVRCNLIGDTVWWGVRLNRHVPYDIKIKTIHIGPANVPYIRQYMFGNGALPAFQCVPGDTMIIAERLSPDENRGDNLRQIVLTTRSEVEQRFRVLPAAAAAAGDGK